MMVDQLLVSFLLINGLKYLNFFGNSNIEQ